jgi:hypothetical protein
MNFQIGFVDDLGFENSLGAYTSLHGTWAGTTFDGLNSIPALQFHVLLGELSGREQRTPLMPAALGLGHMKRMPSAMQALAPCVPSHYNELMPVMVLGFAADSPLVQLDVYYKATSKYVYTAFKANHTCIKVLIFALQ